MGTISLIIGLIVLAVALFPNLGYFILIPAIAGLIMGICKTVRDGYCPWGISGITLNAFAMILALFWTGLISMTSTEMMEEVIHEMQDRPEVMQIFYPVIPQHNQTKKTIPAKTPEQKSAPTETAK